MSRKCRNCGLPTGPNRRLCTECSLEKRIKPDDRHLGPIKTRDGQPVGFWMLLRDEWHASVEFDGYEHVLACGEVFDDFPVDDGSKSHHKVDPEEVCAECWDALDPETVPSEWRERRSVAIADGGRVGPITFAVPEARRHLLRSGFVYTLRPDGRTTGSTWGRWERGGTAKIDVLVTREREVSSKDDLMPFAVFSGFRFPGMWRAAARDTHGTDGLEGLAIYRVVLEGIRDSDDDILEREVFDRLDAEGLKPRDGGRAVTDGGISIPMIRQQSGAVESVAGPDPVAFRLVRGGLDE